MKFRVVRPPRRVDVVEEARALALAVALTVGFTAVYVVLAPFVLLGALLGGPLWAALFPLVEKRA